MAKDSKDLTDRFLSWTLGIAAFGVAQAVAIGGISAAALHDVALTVYFAMIGICSTVVAMTAWIIAALRNPAWERR